MTLLPILATNATVLRDSHPASCSEDRRGPADARGQRDVPANHAPPDIL